MTEVGGQDCGYTNSHTVFPMQIELWGRLNMTGLVELLKVIDLLRAGEAVFSTSPFGVWSVPKDTTSTIVADQCANF